ncbi:flagellar hook-length control protein FliK [Polaromonas sp. YR568]|uniref:flagellar hook-length control protein FliK n=1 Tax=Polaromonas sp. YR568 TaxID=1855301 RepID=UPI00398C0C21
MSLLPPSLSAPAPAPSGTTSSASSAASSRGDESGNGDAPSFGDVLSRSLAASGEASTASSAKAGGKPGAAVPVKRGADEKKADAPEPVNTAALLFIPLETRIAKTAATTAGGTAAAAGGNSASPIAAAPSSDLPADATAPAAKDAAAAASGAANDAGFTVDTEAQAPQALLASGLPAAPGKDRALASTSTAPAAAGDDLAAALPADTSAIPASASTGGQTQQFAGRDGQAGGEAREILGTDTRVEQKTGSAKSFATAANDAGDKAADKTALSAAVDAAPAAAGQRAGAEATATGPSLAVNAAAAPAHANAPASSPAAAAASSQAALTPEVGSGEWGKALGQHMVHMGKAGEHVAELQLNPPGLGPLKVTLSLNDNQVQALFVSAHSSVRAAVEAALPQLRSTLADSGIHLGEASVISGNQQQAAFAQNLNGQDGLPGQPGARGRPGYPGADTASLAAPAPALPARRGSASGVDTYA